MNPPMHQRVKNLMARANLTTDYTVQSLLWTDSGNLAERFIVFRPNGGTAVDRDIGSDHYVLVDLISGKAKGEYAKSEADAQAIIDYVQQNPITDTCVGQITNMGGIPSPVLTTEGRMVWRLQFACLYGE
ncbi:phage tail termination protein [Kluyvera intermedia]|uniref:phage tail termination protein n=1 Tax=Kluyvera intermedia TaxID=61648 RepID=UPI003BA0159D